MDPKRQAWKVWANELRRLGVQEVAAVVLEALGPLTVLGAQLVYLSQPVLGSFTPVDQLDELASLLEDPKEKLAFVQYLREEKVP